MLTHTSRFAGTIAGAGAVLFFGSLAALLLVALVKLVLVIAETYRR